jgi:transmembrane sensor
MEKTADWKLIALHLSGMTSPEQEKALIKWALSDMANQATLDEARKVWRLTGSRRALPEIETDHEWQAFVRRIESDSRKSPLTVYRRTIIGIAATLMLVVVAYFYISRDTSVTGETSQIKNETPPMVTVSSGDSVLRQYLPDSTQVWLNISSLIRYEKEFHGTVFLEGEAYFEVPVDSTRTFKVFTGETETKVVGTAFDIKEGKANIVEIFVGKGKVEFGKNHGKGILLKANEKAKYYPADSSISKEPNIGKKYLGWLAKNNPVFEHEKKTPLSYLKNKYSSKKNVINQTQIEGQLTNEAELASFGKIKLRITYTTSKGKNTDIFLDLSPQALAPGKTITYKKTLFDVFSKKTDVVVRIEKVEVIP